MPSSVCGVERLGVPWWCQRSPRRFTTEMRSAEGEKKEEEFVLYAAFGRLCDTTVPVFFVVAARLSWDLELASSHSLGRCGSTVL